MIRMTKLDPIVEFREDHRKVRDGLLELMEALQSKDVVTARKILGKINVAVGHIFDMRKKLFIPHCGYY